VIDLYNWLVDWREYGSFVNMVENLPYGLGLFSIMVENLPYGLGLISVMLQNLLYLIRNYVTKFDVMY
jgi:hypothetical protein